MIITSVLRYIMQDFFVDLATKGHMDNKIDWFDFCNSDTWSLLYVQEFLEIMKCKNAAIARVYWCEPEKTMADGLRTLRCDADIIAMINESPKHLDVCRPFKFMGLIMAIPKSLWGLLWPLVESARPRARGLRTMDQIPVIILKLNYEFISLHDYRTC
jgi:hypothetical protein